MTDDTKNFTRWKFVLLDCIHADPRLKHAAKSVAYCIAQHLNAKARLAFVGAETISDKTCVGVRDIGRAIRQLKVTGWLKSRKTSTANIYEFSDENVNKMLDRLVILKDARKAKQTKRRTLSARTQESEHNGCARTQESASARTKESDIHFRGTHYRDSAFKESVVEGQGGVHE